MTTNFKEYANYYDSLYLEKEYGRECDYLENLWQTYSSAAPCTILDIGCGTGGHALELAARHHRMTGIDRSPSMLAIARQKAAARNLTVSFHEADIRRFQLPQTFDAAIAMFAVLGYLTTAEDFRGALLCIRQHLRTGGLFVFDLWHKEAVLAIGPEERILKFDHHGTTLTRHARPQLDPAASLAYIHYTLTDPDGSLLAAEIHRVRFFSMEELSDHAGDCGFEMLAGHPFMEPGNSISSREWNIACVLRAA